jgi:hypothetical protein
MEVGNAHLSFNFAHLLAKRVRDESAYLSAEEFVWQTLTTFQFVYEDFQR